MPDACPFCGSSARAGRWTTKLHAVRGDRITTMEQLKASMTEAAGSGIRDEFEKLGASVMNPAKAN
jgi:hypothetical protein